MKASSSAFSVEQFNELGVLSQSGIQSPFFGLSIPDETSIGGYIPIKTSIFADKAAWELERKIFEAIQRLAALTEDRSELEIPEVFTLRPLSSQRVTVQIRKVEPARFCFVDEDINVGNED